jgi:hypothetical protein
MLINVARGPGVDMLLDHHCVLVGHRGFVVDGRQLQPPSAPLEHFAVQLSV